MEQKFFERIKEMRIVKEMTQRQLAEAASIAPGSLSAYEKGDKTPPVDVAARIAKALGVSIDWLFGLEDEAGKGELKSYADVIRTLLPITTLQFHVELTKESIYWQDDSFRAPDDEVPIYLQEEQIAEMEGRNKKTVTVDHAVLKIWNGPLANFFESWAKLYNLYRDGEIYEDMYQAWIDKKLVEFAQMPLPQC